MKRTLATLTALAACAAGAAPATAAETTIRTDYTVTVTGEAFYNVARVTPTEWGDQSHHEDDQFTFRTEIPQISFFDQVGSDSERSLGSATGVRGHLATVNPNGSRIDCDGSEVTDFQAGRIDGVYAAGQTTYKVRALEAIQTAMDCPQVGTYPKRFDSLGAELGSGMWDAEFTMPGGSIGTEEIRIPISNRVTGPKCPGYDEETTVCELSWTAEVVFKRTGWAELPNDGSDLVVPLVPDPQPQPQPAPQPLFETLPGAKLGATSLSVPVTCAAGCTGTATVTLPRGGKALARKAFTLASGATKRIQVTIPKRARKSVKRAGGVKVTLAVKPTGGVRTTKRLLVRR